jgi:hypothetical protein
MHDYSERIIPDRENKENLCKYCYLASCNPVFESNISPLFNITCVIDLVKYLENKNVYEILSVYHPEGYTFIHKLFWNFGRERFAHRNFTVAIESKKMIYYLLENFPELFKELCKLGLKEDPGNTPLHDYIKNISFTKKEDSEFIQYLDKFNLDYSIKDCNDFTFLDYLKLKTLDPAVKKIIQNNQHLLKTIEKTVINNLLKNYKDSFHYCEKCNKIINLYRDIDGLDNIDIMDEILKSQIEQIIKFRQDLNNLYLQNSFSDPRSAHGHNLAIEIWKRKLFLKNKITF